MYDTEKRIELVKKRMHEYHRRQERRTVPCGGNGNHAKPAHKRHGNVRHNSAA